MSEYLIEAEKLTFTYAGSSKPAVKNVSLKIARGEFIVLTGPSGCGKTTLCRIFMGLIPSFYPGRLEGRVKLMNKELSEVSVMEVAENVGFVFQNPENQIIMTTVRREVAFGPENLSLPVEEIERRVDWSLKQTELQTLASENVSRLSGGQKQRLAVASALAMKPKILILDEPLAYLSPKSAENLLTTLKQLNEEYKLTILLVEHRLDLAVRYASRIIVMVDGEIILDGDPRTVFTKDLSKIAEINVPTLVKLYHRLITMGLKLKRVPLTPIEGAREISEVIKNDCNGECVV